MWIKYTVKEWREILKLLYLSKHPFLLVLARYVEDCLDAEEEIILSDSAYIAVASFISGYFLAKEEEGRKT